MGKYTIAKELGVKCVSQRIVQDDDAVMFDIDETLIHVDGSPIEEMISLFKLCKVLGYKTIIITARPDFAVIQCQTVLQLSSLGIFPTHTYHVPPQFKTQVKEQSGYNYVLSVGDLYTDLYGSEYFIKLPDTSDPRVYSNIRLH
ncbi:MAG: HAD hydrolase family protein [Terrimicrobiaceae bacterium]|jgi:hypothetical protein